MSLPVCGAALELTAQTQGLLGAGRRLADGLGGKLRAVVLGPADDALVAAVQVVADTVVILEDELLAEYNPETF